MLLLGKYCYVKLKPVLLCTCAFILAFISPNFSDHGKARGLPWFQITSMALGMKCIPLEKPMLSEITHLFLQILVPARKISSQSLFGK